MNIENIKNAIKDGIIQIDSDKIIQEGILLDTDKNEIKYNISNGWNILHAHKCHVKWDNYKIAFYQYIEKQNYSDERLEKILDSLQLEDNHWNWLNKSLTYMGDGYEWFFMHADGEIQAACLIYHPEKSELQPKNIFYIKYIAVAPWNRENLLRERKFYSVGSTLIKSVLNFSINELGLSPGFSLHSLPQASTFYEKFKMVHIKSRDEDDMMFFELSLNEANELLELS